MFRPIRPAFEKLENREVFSTILGAYPIDPPRTDINDLVKAERDAGPAAIYNPYVTVDYIANGARASGPSGVVFGGTLQGEAAFLKAAPESGPSAFSGTPTQSGTFNLVAADFNNDSRVDGSDFLIWQRQAQPADQALAADFDNDSDVDGADFLTARTAQSHDAVFEELGRNGGGFMGLAQQHPSVLIGLLLP
jgi:hypothetical protein